MLCKLFQTLIGWHLGQGNDLPGWLCRHTTHCAACRAQRDRQAALSRVLQTEAPRQLSEPPPFLRGKILAAVAREERAMPQPVRSWRPAWGLAGFAAVSALVTTLLLVRDSGPATSESQVAVVRATRTATPNLLAQTAKEINGQRLLELTTTLDQPLKTEMDSMLSDALKAATALANNFVPSNLLAQASARQ